MTNLRSYRLLWALLFVAIATILLLTVRILQLEKRIDHVGPAAHAGQSESSNSPQHSGDHSAQIQLPDFSQVAALVAPSVVSIKASVTPLEGVGDGMGAGFFIDDHGHLITNLHVVNGADRIRIRLSDRRELKARLVAGDNESDIAVLAVEDFKGNPLRQADTEKIRAGQWVLGVGAPFGFEQSVAAGVISAKRRFVGEQYIPYLQSDVAINQGNSGGPLVDLEGKVVGVNTKILSMSGGSIGLSFAVPIDLAMDVANQLIENGRVKRGFLGVGYLPVDHQFAQAVALNSLNGARISQVSENSPAERAGLQVDDVVLAIDQHLIQTHNDLPFYFGRIRPGDKVTVSLWRDKKTIRKQIIAGERPPRISLLPEPSK